MEDPWTLSSSNTLEEYPRPSKMEISLSVVEIAYQATLGPIIDPSASSSQMNEEDTFALPSWVFASSRSHDYFDDVFL